MLPAGVSFEDDEHSPDVDSEFLKSENRQQNIFWLESSNDEVRQLEDSGNQEEGDGGVFAGRVGVDDGQNQEEESNHEADAGHSSP